MSGALQPSGAPSWQVDIPNLSQLIIGAGAQGLKQLALSGVDIHAIGCMLMIGEYTPASTEFRKSLNRCREQQRSERLWMYKVVEMGGGQNFLADNLLKTRAGENVLALITATSAVMSESGCLAVLSRLFEISGAALKDIPGLGQLTNIRNALLPFAKKMNFKDRLLKYHSFLWGLVQHGGPPSGDDPYNGILGESSIPSVIEMLHRVATSDGEMRLVFSGMKGAAWVATYARIVLGLEVSAIGKDKTPVALFGDYQTAKVVLELMHSESKCELFKEGSLQSFINSNSISETLRKGWSVDCRSFNFVEYNHPNLRRKEEFARISDFVAMDTLNQVTELATAFTDFERIREFKGRTAPSGFVSYTLSVLPHIQHRSLEILSILGFRPGLLKEYFFKAGDGVKTHQCVGSLQNEVDKDSHHGEVKVIVCQCKDSVGFCAIGYCVCMKSQRACTSLCHQLQDYSEEDATSRAFGLATQKPIRCDNDFPAGMNKGKYLPFGDLLYSKDSFLARLEWYMSPPGDTPPAFPKWNEHLKREISLTMRRAVEFASKLAFTDWDTSIRLMSARFVRHRPMKSDNSPVPLSSGRSFDAHLADAILLCTDSVDAATIENREYTEDWLAYDLDGIVVLRNFAHTRSLASLRGKFLTFYPGRINFEDTQCTSVRSDEAGQQGRLDLHRHPSSVNEIGTDIKIEIEPKSPIKNLSFRPLVSVLKGTLWLRTEVSFNGKYRGLVSPASIARTIPRLLVSAPPEILYNAERAAGDLRLHGYFDELPNPSRWTRGTVRKWHSGFSFNAPESGGLILDLKYGALVSHQATSEDSEAQWLACQWEPESSKSVMVLRRHTCMACVIRNLHPLILEMFDLASDDRLKICIIDGRGRDEALKPCWGPQDLGAGLTALDPTLRRGYIGPRQY